MKMLGHSCTKMGGSHTGRGRRGVKHAGRRRTKMAVRDCGRREQGAGVDPSS